MTVTTIGQELRDRLFDVITANGDGGGATITVYENLGAVNSVGDRVDQPTTGSWIEESIQFGEGSAAVISGDPRRERQTGIYQIVVRTPRNEGVIALDNLTRRVIAAFRRYSTSTLTCWRHTLGGRRAEDAWYRETVQISFWADEQTTAAVP